MARYNPFWNQWNYSKNVIWNARPIVPKGDTHYIYNNTAMDNDQIDIAIFSDQNHGGYNLQLEHRIIPQISLVGVEPNQPHPRESDKQLD